MKQIIILVCSIILGVSLYAMIAGGDGSIASTAGKLWQKQFEVQSTMFESEK